MKKKDYIFILISIIAILPFIIIPPVYEFYTRMSNEHGLIMSFFKFGILATYGEVLGLKIRSGNYNQENFGILPRAIVWGLLGITIKIAIVIFSKGVPPLLTYFGMDDATTIISTPGITFNKVLIAFSISVFMNTFYAPVMMTIHKVTDIHIVKNGGTIRGLFQPIQMGAILQSIDWKTQWGFVFARVIPLFWFPAHTITFLLPEEFQVLFAALLGVMLGLLLAIKK